MSDQHPGNHLEQLSDEELFRRHTLKYNTRNRLAQRLLNSFFRSVGRCIQVAPPAGSVLEVGCGLGESSQRLVQFMGDRRFEVSEFNPRFVAELQRREFPIPIRQESVYELQRSDNSFDCVLLLEVLEHLADPQQALRELFRVSRDRVIISVPHEPLWCLAHLLRGKNITRLGNTPGHINHFTPFSLRRLVSRFGVVEFVSLPFPWIVLVARKARVD
ncbi:MAG: class I SAM-dependent methyltransferase [Candidatus Sumerlaeaceae bacterium]|nr:class I SAM-dependent methyltransferase [Candidatus Sumerlaeaceae bacterium]